MSKILYGLILSGGKSRRMGQDKGLIKDQDQKTWVEKAVEKISPYCEKTFISIRKDQEPFYSPLKGGFDFIFDEEDLEIEGPARGLVSAHLLFKENDWLVLSSDMTNITEEVLRRSVNQYEKDSAKDAYLFSPGGQIEPLCGIYTSGVLDKLMEKMFFTKNYSLSLHLRSMDLASLENSDLGRDIFTSQNSPEDI